ncbi:MAG: bifunctional [glutamate--ammonia ligase]-adenylyl-L-tyrosine phosphorylase/[glutamate--ammonia-ligase] adenylyltransferase [Verrucomicrobiota bacterium]
MHRHSHWIQEKAADSLQPLQVERTLFQLSENWPADAPALADLIATFPLGEAALLHLLAVSQICASRLARSPETFLWLCRPEICSSRRTYGQMRRDLHVLTEESIASNNFRVLRSWKGREMIRIAVRELADVAALEETTAELSQLAEICLAEVFEYCDSELRQRHGSPEAEFTILAMGKLGGRELNHSSDVDLIFLYSEDGEVNSRLTYHEWFNRLGEKIVETFASVDTEAPLFRVDLRLRPEGSAGPLARSLASMENYYAGFGESWERLALIKAREICGSRELAYEFLQHLQPFIYPKSPTPDLLDDVAGIKRRIERDVVGHENLASNVKLGAGGIREIEFVVQALQLIHGARHAFLQETSTLKALQSLHELNLLPGGEVVALDQAYRFLRRVEHRLQIDAEQQIHTVPQDPEQLGRLALSLGFLSSQEFFAALQQQMKSVRAIFQRVISQTPAEAAPIDLSIFNEQKRAAKTLAGLGQGSGSFHVAPRTRQVFRKLRPLLLERLAGTADPDATLNQFIRFVEAYGLRSLLFELLVTHPRLLELLIKTFDTSQFAGDILIRRPQLLEEITHSETLDRSVTANEHLRNLAALNPSGASLDGVRAYRRTQLLRILVRDVLSLVDLNGLLAEHSTLAEACLIFANRLLGSDEVAIIALGKFGGCEISYGADLDVLFVGEDARAPQNLVAAMAQPSAEGNLPALDARLRPDGEKGPLVCPLAAYESYYDQRAQLWEIHALTRARSIIGPNQFIDMAQRYWRRTGQRPDLFQQIDSMLERIRRDRGSGADLLDFKTGAGGIVEGEFLVHALQMRAGIWEPNWANALEQLGKAGILSAAEVSQAKSSYDFLRRCESCLRRRENKSVSVLPSDPEEQRRLAVRLGYGNFDALERKYVAARETIHALYNRRVKDAAG